MRQRQKESESIPKFGSVSPESLCLPLCLPCFDLRKATSFRLYLDPRLSHMNLNPSCLCCPCYQQTLPSKEIHSNSEFLYAFYLSGKEVLGEK